MNAWGDTPSVQPVRVGVLVDTLLAGGAERVAVELACALDRSRFAPHVIASRHSGPLAQLLRDADVPLTVLGRTRTTQALPWLRAHRLVRGMQILHAHKFGSNVWGALLARTAGIPLIVHEHNFAAEATRLRSMFDRRWISPAASRVVCVSESVAAVERAIGVPDHKLVVVPNGVRLQAAWPRAAAREELDLAHDDFVVGIVARLRPEKAHDVLLEAVARLVAEGRPLRLCIVGDGPCRAALEARADELSLGTALVWSGEREDASRLAAAFDVSVVCSHWEGLPLAALEAMAAAVPLVASAVGGLPALLGDGYGLLVPPGDPVALAAAIARCQDEPGAARTRAAAAQRHVRDHYGFRRMVRAIEHVYTTVLSERTALGQLLAPADETGEAA